MLFFDLIWWHQSTTDYIFILLGIFLIITTLNKENIKKKYVIAIGIVLVLLCGVGAYYVWCSYHPDINIHISDGPTGKEGIKIEAPIIAYSGHGIANPSASVEMKIQNITMQHEFFCTYIKDTYEKSDIKLDMEVKDDQTILKYSGTVTDLQNKTEDYKKEIICDYVIDAAITK